jgi:hypothetical protein
MFIGVIITGGCAGVLRICVMGRPIGLALCHVSVSGEHGVICTVALWVIVSSDELWALCFFLVVLCTQSWVV